MKPFIFILLFLLLSYFSYAQSDPCTRKWKDARDKAYKEYMDRHHEIGDNYYIELEQAETISSAVTATNKASRLFKENEDIYSREIDKIDGERERCKGVHGQIAKRTVIHSGTRIESGQTTINTRTPNRSSIGIPQSNVDRSRMNKNRLIQYENFIQEQDAARLAAESKFREDMLSAGVHNDEINKVFQEIKSNYTASVKMGASIADGSLDQGMFIQTPVYVPNIQQTVSANTGKFYDLFAEGRKDIEQNNYTPQKMLFLASLAYDDNLFGRPLPKGCRQLTNKDLNCIDSKGFFTNFMTGYAGVAVIDEGNKTITISHRGTTADLRDLIIADGLNIALNIGTFQQYSSAKDFINCIKNKYQNNYTYIQTGHSLGGAISQCASYDYGDRAITFDAPGVSIEYLDHSRQLDITNYINHSSIVSGSPLTNKQIGKRIEIYSLPPHEEGIFNLSGHGRDKIYEAFNPITGEPYSFEEVTQKAWESNYGISVPKKEISIISVQKDFNGEDYFDIVEAKTLFNGDYNAFKDYYQEKYFKNPLIQQRRKERENEIEEKYFDIESIHVSSLNLIISDKVEKVLSKGNATPPILEFSKSKIPSK